MRRRHIDVFGFYQGAILSEHHQDPAMPAQDVREKALIGPTVHNDENRGAAMLRQRLDEVTQRGEAAGGNGDHNDGVSYHFNASRLTTQRVGSQLVPAGTPDLEERCQRAAGRVRQRQGAQRGPEERTLLRS